MNKLEEVSRACQGFAPYCFFLYYTTTSEFLNKMPCIIFFKTLFALMISGGYQMGTCWVSPENLFLKRWKKKTFGLASRALPTTNYLFILCFRFLSQIVVVLG